MSMYICMTYYRDIRSVSAYSCAISQLKIVYAQTNIPDEFIHGYILLYVQSIYTCICLQNTSDVQITTHTVHYDIILQLT